MHVIFIYLGMLFGIFFEGEMIMLSSVIAAHHEYLNFWIVLPIGIIGNYSSDIFYFSLGRKKEKVWFNKRASRGDKISLIENKLEKYPILIFIIYRFTYGFKTITPAAIWSK